MKRITQVLLICILPLILLNSCNNISQYLKNKNTQNTITNINNDNNKDKIKNNKINYSNMKGVWISYLEYGSLLTEKDENEFKNNIIKVFDNLKSKNINTAIVQVRSHSDAYYKSSIYPWSRYVTGVVAREPSYDPLDIIIKEAHDRNISLHAWINPYRLMTDEQMNLVPDKYLIKKWYNNEKYMTKYENYWYLNPSNEDVQNLIVDGVAEICNNYDVDGVQIDDYFFVPPKEAFKCTNDIAQKSTTSLVKKIYDKIKEIDSNILFGISPAGNYTDKPKSDITQYTLLEKWCTTKGYMDYVAPQIYWDCNDKVAPFKQIISKWQNLCRDKQVNLIIGLAGYKFAKTEELQNQINIVNNNPNLNGYIIFRYDDIK